MPRNADRQRFRNEDLILKVSKAIDRSTWNEGKYEAFLDELCGEREYQNKFARYTQREKPPLPRMWVDGDHHQWDRPVIFRDGSIGRPWLTAIRDNCTLEILGFSVNANRTAGKYSNSRTIAHIVPDRAIGGNKLSLTEPDDPLKAERPEGPALTRSAEFDGESEGELLSKLAAFEDKARRENLGYAVLRLVSPSDQKRVWAVRKAGLGLLLVGFEHKEAFRTGDGPSFQAVQRPQVELLRAPLDSRINELASVGR